MKQETRNKIIGKGIMIMALIMVIYAFIKHSQTLVDNVIGLLGVVFFLIGIQFLQKTKSYLPMVRIDSTQNIIMTSIVFGVILTIGLSLFSHITFVGFLIRLAVAIAIFYVCLQGYKQLNRK